MALTGRKATEGKGPLDRWVETYEDGRKQPSGFPFVGYEAVLEGVVGGSRVGSGDYVLDLGTGTGDLAARFSALGCHVLGVDCSEAMLVQARNKVPEAQFAPLELQASWEVLKGWRFAAIVSSYVLHEFDGSTKMKLLGQMARLLEPGGRIVVGDISFATAAAREASHVEWETVWGEESHYWAADEAVPLLTEAGFQVRYRQVSFCGGVYTLTCMLDHEKGSRVGA